MSEVSGKGGELTQTFHAGLDLVEKGVTLDLGGVVGEDEGAEHARPFEVGVS